MKIKSIFPDINEYSESVPEHPLNEKSVTPEQVEPPAQKNETPVVPKSVKPPVQKDVESARVQNEETAVKRTYEDKFVEEVRNLGPTRQRRKPSRFRDDDDNDDDDDDDDNDCLWIQRWKSRRQFMKHWMVRNPVHGEKPWSQNIPLY